MSRWLQSVQTIFSEKTSDDLNNEFEAKLRNVNFKEEVEWLQRFIEASDFPVVCICQDLIYRLLIYLWLFFR
jgi:hypothetical protein